MLQMSITPLVESLISPTPRFFETMSGLSMNARASNIGATVLNSGLNRAPRSASSAPIAIGSALFPNRRPVRNTTRLRSRMTRRPRT